jgi:mono/diheme cytochrome c family protein
LDRGIVGAVMVAAIVGTPSWVGAEGGATDIWSGIFSEEQVARGAELYASNCASCHGAELVPSDEDIATLTAPAFRWSWQTRTLAERFERISTTMPPSAKGSLSDQEYLDIIAFILHFNGYPAGENELRPDPAHLEQITLTLAP